MNYRYSNLRKIIDSSNVVFDFVVVVFALLLSRFIRARTDLIPGVQLPIGEIPSFYPFILFSIFSGIVFVIIAGVLGIYFGRYKKPFWQEVGGIIKVLIVWLFVLSTYFYFTRDLFFSRLALINTLFLAFAFLIMVRILLNIFEQYLSKYHHMTKRAWIVGNEIEISEIKKLFGNKDLFEFISSFSLQDSLCKDRNIFEERLKKDLPDVLFVGRSVRDEREYFLSSCAQIFGLDYIFLPESYAQYLPGAISIGYVNKQPYMVILPTLISGINAFFKRCFDIFFALFIIICLSPIFLIIVLLAIFFQGFPLIYVSKRVGQYGEVFDFYKFRSMVNNADSMKDKLESMNERSGKLFKIKNDPRITKWGRFIRKWSIDELPQIFNILKGDMSFVGPRPHLPKEVNEYTLEERKLLSVKPGITSFYAVHDRKISFEKEVELEIYYLENWSIILDFYIIWRTFWVVLKGTGE